ncbi:hypothetical protein HO565_04755 [Streptococcus suis]|nr:hypothetical protein [Streptococcus suis]
MQSYDNKPLRNIVFLVCSSAIGLHFIRYSYLGSFGPYALLDFLTLPVVLSFLATYLLLAFWTLKRQKLSLTLHLLIICLLSALLLYGLFKHFPLLQDNIFQVIFLLPLSITLVGLGGACYLWLGEWKKMLLQL